MAPSPQAAEDGVDPGQQLLHLKGLDDVVVGPHLQAGDFVGGFAFGGEHDDGGFVGLPNFGADGPAVHHREHDIQQHQVGAEEAVELQGFAAVLGDHGLVTFLFQVEVDELGDVALVLYDEYFPCHGDNLFLWIENQDGDRIAKKFEQILCFRVFWGKKSLSVLWHSGKVASRE